MSSGGGDFAASVFAASCSASSRLRKRPSRGAGSLPAGAGTVPRTRARGASWNIESPSGWRGERGPRGLRWRCPRGTAVAVDGLSKISFGLLFVKSPKSLRQRLNLSQKELGELLGVHVMTVSKWERGLL